MIHLFIQSMLENLIKRSGAMKHSLYIVLAGCLWGIIAIFVKVLTGLGLSSMECVAVRVSLSTILLLLYILVTDPQKLKIQPKDIVCFLGTGLCSILFFSFCYFKAIEKIGGAAVPALLLYTAPIFVMILSACFFKEKITKRKMICLIATFIGLGFVTGAFSGGEKISAVSFLLGLGSGLGYALYSIFGKFIAERYDAMTITFYTFLVASIGAIPLSGIAFHLQVFGNVKGIVAAVGLAFLSTALPFLLYTKGLQGIEAGKAAILATVEPFVAAVVGALVFGEHFDLPKIVGMLLILFAITFLNLGSCSQT